MKLNVGKFKTDPGRCLLWQSPYLLSVCKGSEEPGPKGKDKEHKTRQEHDPRAVGFKGKPGYKAKEQD